MRSLNVYFTSIPWCSVKLCYQTFFFFKFWCSNFLIFWGSYNIFSCCVHSLDRSEIYHPIFWSIGWVKNHPCSYIKRSLRNEQSLSLGSLMLLTVLIIIHSGTNCFYGEDATLIITCEPPRGLSSSAFKTPIQKHIVFSCYLSLLFLTMLYYTFITTFFIPSTNVF